MFLVCVLKLYLHVFVSVFLCIGILVFCACAFRSVCCRIFWFSKVHIYALFIIVYWFESLSSVFVRKYLDMCLYVRVYLIYLYICICSFFPLSLSDYVFTFSWVSCHFFLSLWLFVGCIISKYRPCYIYMNEYKSVRCILDYLMWSIF